MRRFTLCLLIALLPLQSIWAAAANACQGGCNSGGDFGHHEHVHAGVVLDDGGSAADSHAQSGATCGTDCSSYHGHGLAAVVVAIRLPLSVSRPGVTPSPYERSFVDRCLEGPLRPPQPPVA